MENTNKIYKILKIILIVLLIYGTIKSCAKATFTLNQINEYLDYAQSNPDLFLGNEGVTNLVNVRRLQETKFNEIFANGIPDYSAISCTFSNTTYTIRIFYHRSSNSSISYDKITLNNTPTIRVSCNVDKHTYNGTSWSFEATSNTSVDQYTRFMILLTTSNYTNNLKTYISELTHTELASQQQYMFALPRSSNAVYTNNNEYVTAFDIRIGQNMNIANLTANIYVLNQSTKVYQSIQKEFIQASGTNQYILNFLSEDLSSDNTYYIELYYNGVLWVESEGQRIIKSVAPTPTPSGDNQGGSNIDLTTTNNKIDNLTNVVQSGDKQIIEAITKLESGEQQRQSFWEKAYNDLFTISGDYITNKFEELREQQKISGDYEIEENILNLITNNSNDFIISWEDLTTHFTIKGEETTQLTIPHDQINFSKMERENEDLHTTMEWARTIIGFSLGILLLRNYWTTLLLMLGVGIQVYDKTNDEKESITITTDEKGNKTTTRKFKTGNITQKWVNKK